MNPLCERNPKDGRYFPEADGSSEHVRQLSPSIDVMSGRRRSCPRRLRVSIEPLDFTELAIEHTSETGRPRSDPRNRVLLLEDADVVWLDEILHKRANEIRAGERPPVSGVHVNPYGSSSLTAQLGELARPK